MNKVCKTDLMTKTQQSKLPVSS